MMTSWLEITKEYRVRSKEALLDWIAEENNDIWESEIDGYLKTIILICAGKEREKRKYFANMTLVKMLEIDQCNWLLEQFCNLPHGSQFQANDEKSKNIFLIAMLAASYDQSNHKIVAKILSSNLGTRTKTIEELLNNNPPAALRRVLTDYKKKFSTNSSPAATVPADPDVAMAGSIKKSARTSIPTQKPASSGSSNSDNGGGLKKAPKRRYKKIWLNFEFSDYEAPVKIEQSSSRAEIPVTTFMSQQSANFILLTNEDSLPKRIDEKLCLCFDSIQSRLKPFIIKVELLRQKRESAIVEKLSEKTFVLETKDKVARVLGLAPRLLWDTIGWVSDHVLNPDWDLQNSLTELDKFRVDIKISLQCGKDEVLDGSIEACGNRLENKAIWNIEKM